MVVETSIKPSSRHGIVLFFVGLVIFVAAVALLWRANVLARILPDGLKARYSLVADDPLK